MIDTTKEVKDSLQKLYDAWSNAVIFLESGSGTGGIVDETNKAQVRALRYCMDSIYYLNESILDEEGPERETE